MSLNPRRLWRELLLAAAWICWVGCVAFAAGAQYWAAAGSIAAAVVCMRVRRRWPWPARLILRWEIRQLSGRGTVDRWSLNHKFVRVAPEPHKTDL